MRPPPWVRAGCNSKPSARTACLRDSRVPLADNICSSPATVWVSRKVRSSARARSAFAERRAAAVQEECCRGATAHALSESRSGLACIALQRRGAWGAEQHDPLLVALPRHPRLTAIEVDVAHLQRNELSDTEACAIEQLDKGDIAQREFWAIPRRRHLDECDHLFGAQHIRESSLALRPREDMEWIARHAPFAHPEPIEGPKRREALLHRCPTSVGPERCDVATQVCSFGRTPIDMFGIAPGEKSFYGSSVRAERGW